MSSSVRDSYIASIDPAFVPAVLALDSAVTAVHADFVQNAVSRRDEFKAQSNGG